MKHDSVSYPLKLILGFLAIVVLALPLASCGSLVSVGYQHPQYGGASVEFALPKKGGFAK